MKRAPSALFKRARRLYLDKYPLDGRDYEGALRLFVAAEQIQEWVEPDPETATGQIAVVTIRPTRLALVHWQSDRAAPEQLISDYLANTWALNAKTFSPMETPWFRNSGHHQQGEAPAGLIWTRRSPFTTRQPDAAESDQSH